MSLRLRLTLIVIAAVSLSMCLVLWLAWERIGQEMTEQRKRDLASMLQAEESLLEEGVKNYLAYRMRLTGERRSQMQNIAATVRGLANKRDASPNEGMLKTRFFAEIARHTPFALIIVDPHKLQGQDAPFTLGGTSLPAQGLALLVQNVSANGDFLVADDKALPGMEGEHLLLFALPLETTALPKPATHAGCTGPLLLVALPLSNLATASASFKANLLLRVYNRYLEDELVQTVIWDRDGRILACTSHDLPAISGDAVADLAQKATGTSPSDSTSVSTIVEQNDRDYLVVGKYFKSVGWTLGMQIDMETVTGPVTRAFTALGWLTLAFLLSALILSVLAMQKTLRPLLQLTVKTRRLAHLDMSGKDALEELERTATSHLPLKRHDELGELARAYASMGHALVHNIKDLMRETAARERMAGEIAAAASIQKDMLPGKDLVRSLTAGHAAAFLRPAREVGGDLYDVLALDDGRTAFVVGDVSGKGVAAALFMAKVVTHVRFCLRECPDPARAMTKVNTLLEQNNEANMFVTLFMGIFDAKKGLLAYANGGHCAPLCVRKNGSIEPLPGLSGPVVGVVPNLVYQGFSLHLNTGDRVYVYTDGVTEARDRDGNFFGETRLAQSIAKAFQSAPDASLALLVWDVESFANGAGQADDITILCLEQGELGLDTHSCGEERA